MWWHLLVRTLSGATYLFRFGDERTYVTSIGSSTGMDLSNLLVDPTSVNVRLGERMLLRSRGTGQIFRGTASVVYWELERVIPAGWPVVTSHDGDMDRIAVIPKDELVPA